MRDTDVELAILLDNIDPMPELHAEDQSCQTHELSRTYDIIVELNHYQKMKSKISKFKVLFERNMINQK